MIRGTGLPEYYALPSQTENLLERPTGSMFGDNPSGWAFGRMGQIYMGRTSPPLGTSGGLAADECPLLKEYVDERRYPLCERRFNSFTGTVLEYCRKPLFA